MTTWVFDLGSFMLGCVFSLGFVTVVISLIYRAEKNIDQLDKEWKALCRQAKNRVEAEKEGK